MRAEALRASDGGVLVDVLVTPGARRTEFLKDDPWRPALRIALAAPATRGKANAALVAFLAEVFGVPRPSVAVVRGATARAKTVAVAGIGLDAARGRLRGRPP